MFIMVKLTMVAENHTTKKLSQIGPLIANRATALPGRKTLVLAEGPILSGRERAILQGSAAPEKDSEALLLAMKRTADDLFGKKYPQSPSLMDDMEAHSAQYIAKRQIDKFEVHPLEPAVFSLLLTPRRGNETIDEVVGPQGAFIYGFFQRFLDAFRQHFGAGEGIEAKIIAEFQSFYSFMSEIIKNVSASLEPKGKAGSSIANATFLAEIEAFHAKFDAMCAMFDAMRAIIEETIKVEIKTAELRSVIHMETIARTMGEGFEEIFTISGISHVVDLFSSPLIKRKDDFIKAEKEIIVVADSVEKDELKVFSDNAKVTVV